MCQALLERAEGKLTQTCLLFHRREYVPLNGSEKRVLDRVTGSAYGRRRVRYDARDVTNVVVYPSSGHTTSVWTLGPEDRIYEGWSEDEVEDHLAWRLQGGRQSKIDDVASKARWRTEQQALAREKAAEMEGIVAKVGPEGIRADRAAEVLAASAAARNDPPVSRPQASRGAVPVPATSRRSFEPSALD